MKLRNPKEFAAAMTKIRIALEEGECARVVGRSESLIRKWCDPDHPSAPNIHQALQLDSAYVSGGYGPPPLLRLYEELLDDIVNGKPVSREYIVPSALMIQAIVGELSETIRETILSGVDGPAQPISPQRRTQVLEIIDRLEEETNRLEDAVEGAT